MSFSTVLAIQESPLEVPAGMITLEEQRKCGVDLLVALVGTKAQPALVCLVQSQR
jgi:hypothetical protein